jgi:hypothetical protein
MHLKSDGWSFNRSPTTVVRFSRTMPSASLVGLVALIAAAPPLISSRPSAPTAPSPPSTTAKAKQQFYTTYFYTAGEAVVQGYETDTHVRIISLTGKKGTIWEGTVHRGDSAVVKTGAGSFGFLSDKKAAILVGTPQSCTCVGYFGKDETGSFRSNHMFVQLPPAASNGPEKLVIWAMEDGTVLEVRAPKLEKTVKKATLQRGQFLTLSHELNPVAGANVELVASTGTFTAQVYWDEGFTVPADTGSAGGKSFHTYVGTITNQVNDLNVLAPRLDSRVVVTDLVAKKVLFEGTVKGGTAKTLTLADKYVSVTSDVPVNVVVAALEHYKTGYAEHHFAAGIEGTQIDNEFLVTTSGELWLFSYYDGNDVTVKDTKGETVFSGRLGMGEVKGLQPGHGLFQVRASRGLSAMGGASACGADYSPAGGLFAIDEAVLEVVAQIREERVREAATQGRTLTASELAAPVNEQEWTRHKKSFDDSYATKARPKGAKGEAAAPAAAPMSLDEFNQRSAAH